MGLCSSFLLTVLVTCAIAIRHRVFVVSILPHLGYHARDSLWRTHGLHPERSLFRSPSSYLVSTNPRLVRRIAADPRVEAVKILQPLSKSSLIVSRTALSDATAKDRRRNATLKHDVDAICSNFTRRVQKDPGTIAADLLGEFAKGYSDAVLNPAEFDGHELAVTSLCFYNADDCALSWFGRQRELNKLLGDDAKLIDESMTEYGKRVLVLKVPRGTSLCAVAHRLALMHYIVGIERRSPYAVLNAFASAAAQTGASESVSMKNAAIWKQGLLGQGEVVGVGDTGVDLESCYFREHSVNTSLSRLPLSGRKCDLNRRKVVCYYVAEKASFGDDASHRGGGHGTHVSGTIAGLHASAVNMTENLYELLEHITNHSHEMNGIAPLARIAVNDIGAGGGPLAAPADIATSAFVTEPYAAAGVRIHSNSWGCGASPRDPRSCNAYDSLTRSMDEFMFLNKDAILVVAAGNSGDSGAVDVSETSDNVYKDGFYTVGAPGTFKNGIAVGATQRGEAEMSCAALDSEPKNCSLENLFSASARGPTLDGRIKPDVVFPGERIVSARSSEFRLSRARCISNPTMGVHVISGTSMACPGVAGALALIRQYFREFNPSTGKRGEVSSGPLGDGKGPSGSLLKATLIAAAKPLTGHYTYRSGMSAARKRELVKDAFRPDFLQGFGRPQLDAVLRFSDTRESPSLLVFDRHDQGHGDAPHVHTVHVEPGGRFAAVLVYADAPGPVQEAWQNGRVLVNDLDLSADCAHENDCDLSQDELSSSSRLDNVERIPRGGGSAVAISGTVVKFRVKALKIVTRRQHYALVVVGKGLSFMRNSSTPRNWKPDWSESVRYPQGAEPAENTESRNRVMNFAIVAIAAVGGFLILAGLVAMIALCWHTCTKDEESAMGEQYNLHHGFSM